MERQIVQIIEPLLDRVSTNAGSGYGTSSVSTEDYQNLDHHKSVLHHFKVTKTQTTEGDFSVISEDQNNDKEGTRKKKRWWSCFNSCFCNEKG